MPSYDPVFVSDDGPRLTVNQLVKDPTVIPRRLVEDVKKEFISDKLLRRGPAIPSGSIVFQETEPQFADDDPEVFEEYSEIPLTSAQRGRQHTAKAAYYGRGLRISERTVSRNNYDRLALDMGKLRNNFARQNEQQCLTALFAGLSQQAVTTSWTSGTLHTNYNQTMFAHIAQAVYNIQNVDVDTTDGTGTQKLQFDPDTLVISKRLLTRLLFEPDVQRILAVGQVQAPQGLLNGNAISDLVHAMGLKNIVVSRTMDSTKAIVLEAGTVGFESEERALRATALQKDEATESYYTYVTRGYAIAIDQPKAGIVLTGVASAGAGNFTTFA